jgi:hypothetical protein
MADKEQQDTSMVLPGADKIRKVWHQEQWFGISTQEHKQLKELKKRICTTI